MCVFVVVKKRSIKADITHKIDRYLLRLYISIAFQLLKDLSDLHYSASVCVEYITTNSVIVFLIAEELFSFCCSNPTYFVLFSSDFFFGRQQLLAQQLL